MTWFSRLGDVTPFVRALTHDPKVELTSVLKYNLCHGKDGRFCATGGGKQAKTKEPEKKEAAKPAPKKAPEKKPEPKPEVKAKAKETPKKEPPKETPKPKAKETEKPKAKETPKEAPKAKEAPKEEAKPEKKRSEKTAEEWQKEFEWMTPEQAANKVKYEADLEKARLKDNAFVKSRYERGIGDELSDKQKEYFGIGPEVKFGSKKKVPKASSKPSDVKSDHAQTQALLDASTPEGVTAALTAMGWKSVGSAKSHAERNKIAENNDKIAKDVRKHIFAALEKSPRGSVKIKQGGRKGEDVKDAEALQANANLMLHPTIAKGLKHKSVFIQGRNPDTPGALAAFQDINEGVISMGSSVPKKEREAIFVHEFGHKIENQSKGLLSKAKKKVADAVDMVNDYSSTEYDHGKGTEYVSSGFEHYFRDPVGFAGKAPDHFAFIHRMVTRGEIA